jgi:hypothetical protein
MIGRDVFQHAAPGGARAGEAAVAERAVGDDRHTLLLTPGHYRVLDCALLQVVEHLVAGDPAGVCDGEHILEIVDVEIANAPRQDLAARDEVLQRSDRVFEGIRSAPVEEVAVEPIGLKAA